MFIVPLIKGQISPGMEPVADAYDAGILKVTARPARFSLTISGSYAGEVRNFFHANRSNTSASSEAREKLAYLSIQQDRKPGPDSSIDLPYWPANRNGKSSARPQTKRLLPGIAATDCHQPVPKLVRQLSSGQESIGVDRYLIIPGEHLILLRDHRQPVGMGQQRKNYHCFQYRCNSISVEFRKNNRLGMILPVEILREEIKRNGGLGSDCISGFKDVTRGKPPIGRRRGFRLQHFEQGCR